MRPFPNSAELKKINFLVDMLELYNVYLADFVNRTRLSALERASIMTIMTKKMMLTAELRELKTLLHIPLRAEMLISYWGKRVFAYFRGRHA